MRIKKTLPFLAATILTSLVTLAGHRPKEDPVTLPIGAPAPDFSLLGIDDKTYTLASFQDARLLVVIFTCNHCPTAQAYEDRIIRLVSDFEKEKVAVVAVSPNDPDAIRLDELGYSDLSDSFEEMKIRAREKKFNFPYLYDGETQSMSKAYGPVATPHVFIFDEKRKLRFQGRIDDVEKPGKTPAHNDTRRAIEELLANKPVSVSTTRVFGCSVKWATKTDWIAKAKESWSKEPVQLQTITNEGIRSLLTNESGKLRVINVWGTWCGPCIVEFPEFITINRMYRGRDFELVTICLDDTAKKSKALDFLKKQEASCVNYLYDIDHKYTLIDLIGNGWPGALPFTIIVEPGGKVYYTHENSIDPAELKKLIVEHPLIGRFY